VVSEFPSKVAVIGLGLIGGSIALRCRDRGLRIVGYDADAATRTAAATQFPVADTLAAAVTGADLVVLAVPLTAMAATARALASTVSPAAIITDVGSVKTPVRAALQAVGLGGQYLGGHPMAGNEHSGFAAADPMLLVGAKWALTHPDGGAKAPGIASGQLDEVAQPLAEPPTLPPSGDQPQPTSAWQQLNLVYRWVTDTFDATVIELSDGAHDRAQALISGLPHVFAVELLNLTADSASAATALKLAAGSFRDGTRVAHTDPARTHAFLMSNASEIAPLIAQAARDLQALADRLSTGADCQEFFTHANALR